MIFHSKTDNNHDFRVVLTPNRSISWPILLRFYLFTCAVSFSIATLFASLGYWVVLPFSGLEMLCLGAGLYVTCRKIYCQEVISVNDHTLMVEKGCHKADSCWQFDRHWVRIKLEESGVYRQKLKLFIGSHGTQIEVGSFLNDAEKESLAFELNAGILTQKFLRQIG